MGGVFVWWAWNPNTFMEIRLLLDVICKYIVLFMFSSSICFYIYKSVLTGKTVDLPDWLVSVITIIIMYFFRRSPSTKKENKDVGKNNNSIST